jgi:hypothetical protein
MDEVKYIIGRSEKYTKAFILSLVAGILIVCNTVILGIAARWFPSIIPTLPGSSANDTAVLYRLTAIGLVSGILVLLGAIMLHSKPGSKKTLGIIIVVFSISSVITGGGFIVGFILGIIGGALALSRKSKKQETH